MLVVPCALRMIAQISAVRLSLPADLRPADAKRAVMLQLQVGGMEGRASEGECRPIVGRGGSTITAVVIPACFLQEVSV